MSRHKVDYNRRTGYIGAPGQRQRAMDDAKFRGTDPGKCGPVRCYTPEERKKLEDQLNRRGRNGPTN